MEKATAAIAALILATATGCTVGIPLDANMRIAIDAPNQAKYSQNGREIDQDDMRAKLRKEGAAAEYIDTADSLDSASRVFAVASSLIATWPIASTVVDGKDPRMVGLGLSLGTSIVSVILWGAGEAYVEKAARAHNGAVDEPNREKQERQQRIVAAKSVESLPKLPEGFGFDFDADSEAAEIRCKSNGYEWSVTEGISSCSGIPMPAALQGSSGLTFADGKIQTLRISVRPRNNSSDWATANSKTEQVVMQMYGQPDEKNYIIPSECVGSAFLGCIHDGRVKGRVVWSGKKKRSVTMAIVNTPPHPWIVVDVKRVAGKTEGQ